MNFIITRLLTIQAFTVIVVSLALVLVASIAADRFDEEREKASGYSGAAIDAALIEANVERLVAMGSQEVIQSLIANEGANLNDVPIPVVLEVRSRLIDSSTRAAQIEAVVGPEESRGLKAAADRTIQSMDAFLDAPGPETFAQFSNDILALQTVASGLGPELAARSDLALIHLRDVTRTTRLAVIAAAIASAIIMTATIILLGRRTARSAELLRDERDALVEATSVLERRNTQFRALYQVVSEVSETLSTRYVTQTAVREARKLVGADVVALRLLRGDQLELAGVDSAADLDTQTLESVPLGSGVTGRSAKRGKTERVDEEAHRVMADGERVETIQSGVVVPLIVGARVVGTMGCWSRNPNHFNIDDERILEMMASQVATAVTAAGSHELSEQNAHRDALTGLFNRRQLTEDINTFFAGKVHGHQAYTLAMIDIDHFGNFNKEHGHRVGDITLQQVAHILQSSTRDTDRVYRYGGEEFLIAFGCALSEAQVLGERLRTAVERAPHTGEDLEPIGPVTISVGLAAYPEHGVDYDDIVELADRALRVAKRSGRNRVVTWSDEISSLVA